MKFILIVILVHFVGEVIMNKTQKGKEHIGEKNKDSRHPAEFQVRN
jgi:hypothetical protein